MWAQMIITHGSYEHSNQSTHIRIFVYAVLEHVWFHLISHLTHVNNNPLHVLPHQDMRESKKPLNNRKLRGKEKKKKKKLRVKRVNHSVAKF